MTSGTGTTISTPASASITDEATTPTSITSVGATAASAASSTTKPLISPHINHWLASPLIFESIDPIPGTGYQS